MARALLVQMKGQCRQRVLDRLEPLRRSVVSSEGELSQCRDAGGWAMGASVTDGSAVMRQTLG